jgi:phage terminase small subunit
MMAYKRSAELTPMALRAIHYHMRGWNKQQSMRMAGYSEASVLGNQEKFWRSKAVQAEIRERMRKLAVKTDITVEKLVAVLKRLLEVEPGDLMNEEGKPLSPRDIPPEVARCLNWKVVHGRVVWEAVDKLRIVELIAKLTGIGQESTLTIKTEGDLQAKVAAARKQLAEVIDVRPDLGNQRLIGQVRPEGPGETGERPRLVVAGDDAPLEEVG